VKAKCNYCKRLLGGHSSNGTSHLKSHVKSCLQKKISNGCQRILCPNYVSQGNKELVATSYNADVSKKELACAIVAHEYPLCIVDHLYFKKFVCSLQPLFTVPSRNTMQKEIFKSYNAEKRKIQKVFDMNKGRIYITTDMWTTTHQNKGYMAITGHCIDNPWNLQNHLLIFAYVPVTHTAERLASVLVDCLMDWNLNSKVSTITFDNDNTNDAMIDKIKKSLALWPYSRGCSFTC
ncbi:Putative AC transposase, partial [Linum grandiflorum]